MPITANLSSNRDLTLWAQLQANARTINNSGGVWNSSGASKLRFDSFAPTVQNPTNAPTFKTGKRSKLPGVRGRQGAGFNLSKPFIPSGIPGTVPDDDPIIQAFMGQASISGGSSVTYNLSDAIKFLFFAMFNDTPGMTNPTNTYLIGAVPQTVKFTLNGNFLNYSVQGTAVGAGDSTSFSQYSTSGDSVLTGGLSGYPTEPGSFIENGEVIAGFGAGAGVTINGSSLAEMRATVGITLTLGTEGVSNALNDAYTVGFVGGARICSIDQIQCIDSDGTVLAALKTASRLKTLEAISFQLGTSAGSVVTLNLKNVQVGDMSWQEDGAALDVQFAQSDASATDVNSTDEFQLVIT